VLVLIFFPETKGKSLEQIQAKLGLGKPYGSSEMRSSV
jgi:hypothetical protein